MRYTAPTDGLYEFKSEIVFFIPTGEFEEVENPNYRWWKPWVPKTILQKKYRRHTEVGPTQLVRLKQGESIAVTEIIGRIGSTT